MSPSNLDRRSFLTHGVAGTVSVLSAPWIVPARAWARGSTAPSERIGMACIGTGGMGTNNLKTFLHRDDVDMIGVCDVDRRHARGAKNIVDDYYTRKKGSKHDSCVVTGDFRELLARPDIDAVMIATPDHWHAIMSIAAARAGKDIYCEKPISVTIGEGRATVDAVKRLGRIFQTGSWQRSQERFRRACEWVRNGRIGHVQRVEVGLPGGKRIGPVPTMPIPDYLDYDMWLGSAPYEPYTEARCHYNFRYIFDYSGGKICDWGAHHHDITQWGLGVDRSGPIGVEGVGDFPTEGIYDTAVDFDVTHVYGETPVGSGVVVHTSNRNPQGVKFVGDEGWIFVSRGKLDASPKEILSSGLGASELHLYSSQDHADNFIECVRTRRETATPAEVAHRSISLAHLGNVAMRTGRVLEWDPVAETFPNDADACRYLQRGMRTPWHL